jgi:hypothetical protein
MSMTTTRQVAQAGTTDDRIVVLSEPRPGTVVELTAGSQLAVRFRPSLGPSRWQIAELPGYLVPLAQSGHEFQFLVFGCPEATVPLRLERRHPDRELVRDVCELLVVPVSDAGVQTSMPASPRTA